MTRLGQMLMDEGMEQGIELNQTDSSDMLPPLKSYRF